MNIDHALEQMRNHGVSPATLERLRSAAQHLPEREAMPEPEGGQAVAEAMSLALQFLGLETPPAPPSLSAGPIALRESPPKAAVGAGDDEPTDWQKSLWKERQWKK